MSPPTPPTPSIGPYRLVKRLAVGGMADIWLAQLFTKKGYERTAVVKTIRSDLVDEDDLITMLIEEARIARCLKHPNIVEMYEVGEQDSTQYLAMEFVFGRDLRQIRDRCLERGLTVPYEHAVTILADVLEALDYAYNEAVFEGRPLRVIHRDVSPQNIIVGFDGSVKLLDFGMAKAAAQLSRTRAGVLKGKYAYMSPEQVDFRELDQRADVFSAGIVLWEMLTQRRLFYRNGEYETVKAVMACRVPFARAVRADIPWGLAWITARALRRSPRWRFGSAAAMRRALLGWDKRPVGAAHDALAHWMSELFEEELGAREEAINRSFRDPERRRQLQDAGFELVEHRSSSSPRGVARMARGGNLDGVFERDRSSFRAPPGWPGLLLGSLLGTKVWFALALAIIVAAGISLGVYLGSLHGADAGYGYLSVRSARRGVDVIIGGRPVGKTPVSNVPVLPGRHRVVGRLGDQNQTIEIVVPAGGRETVQLGL